MNWQARRRCAGEVGQRLPCVMLALCLAAPARQRGDWPCAISVVYALFLLSLCVVALFQEWKVVSKAFLCFLAKGVCL